MEIELNKHGVNKKIKANRLSDAEMRSIGFTDSNKNNWYFCKILKGVSCTTFNVTISKKDSEDLSIDILDEEFGQPYGYQFILTHNPNNKFALIVNSEVEYWMKYLEENGVLSGHKYGEYI